MTAHEPANAQPRQGYIERENARADRMRNADAVDRWMEDVPSGPNPTLDQLADEFLAAGKDELAKRRRGEVPHGPHAIRCAVCDLVRGPDERDCPECGEQRVMQL